MMMSLGYIVNILEDAKIYSAHADKTEIDESDVRLAIQSRMDHSFTSPPPRDVCDIIMTLYDIIFLFSFLLKSLARKIPPLYL